MKIAHSTKQKGLPHHKFSFPEASEWSAEIPMLLSNVGSAAVAASMRMLPATISDTGIHGPTRSQLMSQVHLTGSPQL